MRIIRQLAFSTLVLAWAAVSVSCKTTKKSTGASDAADNLRSRLTSYKQMEFDRYYFDGLKEKLIGNYARSAENFEDALHLDDNNAAAHYELGTMYFQLSRYKDAEDHLARAEKLNPENKWYGIMLADLYKFEKKWPEASALYEKLIEKNPQQAELYFDLAQLYMYQKKEADALRILDKVEKVFGMNEQVVLQKHQIYYQAGKYDKAVEELNKLIASDPDNSKYFALLAETYTKWGKPDKAIEIYNKMLAKDPDNGDAQLSLAEYYYQQGDKAKSFDMLKKAFANRSVNLDQKIGILYSNYLMQNSLPDSEKKDAYTLSEILVKAHPEDAKSHAIYGDFLYQDKRLEEARHEYLESIKYKKDVFAVWQQLFLIESERRNFTDMEKESEQAMDYFPNQPIVYFFNGVAKTELKKYKDAVAVLESGLNMVVDNKPLEVQFETNLADVNYRMKNFSESDAWFDKALEADPNNALALNNYAYYLSERNEKLDKAEEMSKKSLGLEPGNASYLDTYGWILFMQGKYADAEKYIKQALDKDPKAAEVNEHYGDVQFKLGNTDAAVDYWKKAKEYGSESDKLDSKIRNRKIE